MLLLIILLGLLHEATRRQTSEEFQRAGRPSCRARRVALNRCRRSNNRLVG